MFAGGGVMAVGTKELSVRSAAGKSEFGVCGGVGGVMVIELLAGTMRRGRWVIERMSGNARRRIGGGNGKIHGKGMNAARQSCEHFEG